MNDDLKEPAPSPDREKLIAEAKALAWKLVGEDDRSEAHSMLYRLIDALAAQPMLDPEKVEAWLSGPTHAPANTHSQADGSCTECPWPRYMLPASEWVADFCEAAKRGDLS